MIYTLLAPDPTFTGNCSGVEFNNGIGFCDSEFLVGWLCAKGFTIIPESLNCNKDVQLPTIPENLDDMNCDELVTLARAYSVPLAGIRPGDKEALVAAIIKAVRKNE